MSWTGFPCRYRKERLEGLGWQVVGSCSGLSLGREWGAPGELGLKGLSFQCEGEEQA
jgi:hypothetical protein